MKNFQSWQHCVWCRRNKMAHSRDDDEVVVSVPKWHWKLLVPKYLLRINTVLRVIQLSKIPEHMDFGHFWTKIYATSFQMKLFFAISILCKYYMSRTSFFSWNWISIWETDRVKGGKIRQITFYVKFNLKEWNFFREIGGIKLFCKVQTKVFNTHLIRCFSVKSKLNFSWDQHTWIK